MFRSSTTFRRNKNGNFAKVTTDPLLEHWLHFLYCCTVDVMRPWLGCLMPWREAARRVGSGKMKKVELLGTCNTFQEDGNAYKIVPGNLKGKSCFDDVARGHYSFLTRLFHFENLICGFIMLSDSVVALLLVSCLPQS
jgi:hypothetical protein